MNTPNVSAQVVSSGPRLLKQQLYAGYTMGRRWYMRSAVHLPHECFCGQLFRTQQARDKHLRDCHGDGDSAG